MNRRSVLSPSRSGSSRALQQAGIAAFVRALQEQDCSVDVAEPRVSVGDAPQMLVG
jgi:hypothetical protein